MANTEKLFDVVGTSFHDGQTKVRWGNDIVLRVKALARRGHSEIKLMELPREMTKLEAVEYLQTQPLSREEQFVVDTKVVQMRKKESSAVKKATTKGEVKAVKAGPSLAKIRARGLKTESV